MWYLLPDQKRIASQVVAESFSSPMLSSPDNTSLRRLTYITLGSGRVAQCAVAHWHDRLLFLVGDDAEPRSVDVVCQDSLRMVF